MAYEDWGTWTALRLAMRLASLTADDDIDVGVWRLAELPGPAPRPLRTSWALGGGLDLSGNDDWRATAASSLENRFARAAGEPMLVCW